MERRVTMNEATGEKDELLENRKEVYEVKADSHAKEQQKPSVSATSLHNSEVSQS